jgi:hypothetical protein
MELFQAATGTKLGAGAGLAGAPEAEADSSKSELAEVKAQLAALQQKLDKLAD